MLAILLTVHQHSIHQFYSLRPPHTATSIILFIKVRLLLIFVSLWRLLVCAKIVHSVKCGFYEPQFGLWRSAQLAHLKKLNNTHTNTSRQSSNVKNETKVAFVIAKLNAIPNKRVDSHKILIFFSCASLAHSLYLSLSISVSISKRTESCTVPFLTLMYPLLRQFCCVLFSRSLPFIMYFPDAAQMFALLMFHLLNLSSSVHPSFCI